MLFKDLSLVEPLLRALETEGYETPTPIQQQAIPPVLAGNDLLGCAQTGTGKTAAFALPILQRIYSERKQNPGGRKPIHTLILTPTRELAIQIGDSFTAYGRHTGVKNLVIFGGVSQHAQTQALKNGTDVLVATPGRLLDLMNQGFIQLKDISVFVLDEADRMLDMGFIHDVKKVIARLPQKRQTLFFSATMPDEIASLADSILTNPVKVAVTPVSSTAEKVAQLIYFVDKQDKKNLLVELLKNPEIKSALVFTRTKHGANKVAAGLSKSGIKAEAIHGNKSQNARQAALSGFKTGRLRVLVATDIAARGIDIDDLTHVINFDLPNIPETYVHRIGRTGRAGASGIALSFCESEELPYLKDIQKLTGQVVPVVEDHPFKADLKAPGLPEPRQQPVRTANKPSGDRREGRHQRQQQRPPQPAQKKEEHKPVQQQQRQQQNQPGGQKRGESRPQQPQSRPQRSGPQDQPNNRDQRQHQPAKIQQQPPREQAQVMPERKNRFASILEASKLEKQPSFNKPKPDYREGKKEQSGKSGGNAEKGRRRSGWRGNDRVKKSGY